MAAMMLMIVNFINAQSLLKFANINIIASISWPPPLISQLFSPRLLKPHYFFYSLAVFVWMAFTKLNIVYCVYLVKCCISNSFPTVSLT